ncbi:3-hydroxybutyrate dehydrogenase [Chitinolyticbacter albus]|uniref:3-hydroxybutyrate dehydrogenase n=1 Tax=Chitinolyticbacter albus TaxID=2961951 RepID=UPI00210D2FFE|nr:3-hydroxybutyrate dehydrogenase [Chitinolyticbacter albus]
MLHGKTALVTGSTSGIGLGIARPLAAAGADVMLNGIEARTDGMGLATELAREFNVRVGYRHADLARPDAVAGLVASADAEFGKVDILVNHAGTQYSAAVEDFPPEQWDAILATHLSAVFHATRAVLPQMRNRNWGRIVNIASAHGLVASVHMAAYVAAKHAVLGLTRVVALETATTGITCNAICPGWVLTSWVQQQIDELAAREGFSEDEARQALLVEKQPSLELVTSEQIGALTAFLCSDAASQMRGTALPVDGGWTAQ